MQQDGRSLRRSLEEERLSAEDALAPLARAANEAPTLQERIDAYRALGEISGRAFDASWDTAERAAFLLLEAARDADAPLERVGLLHAMGRGFRNLWLLPYVHSRLSDDDETVVGAAISAAGGLALPALEEAIASGFLGENVAPRLRLTAISALGRMGAESASTRLVPFVTRAPTDAAAALAALTEIRSRVGETAALEVLSRDPSREVLVAAIRYLAEVGNADVLRTLRRLARDEDADLRIEAGLASRAFKAERSKDAGERILAAITERDRAVRAVLARRLRTLPVESVLEQGELLLSEDPEGVIQIIAEVRAPEITKLLLRLAEDETLDVAVRARAAGAIEANEPWERDALADLVDRSSIESVRATAARTLGAFASPAFVLDRLAKLADDRAASLRAALLWALQLAARPDDLQGELRARAEALVKRALADSDPFVRRRAAYVAGNLHATALVPELIELARNETDAPDLRVAAMVGLSEIGETDRISDLVFLFNREDDPRVLGVASRAIERSLDSEDSKDNQALERVRDRLRKLVASNDGRVRAAAARVAGLTKNAVPTETIAKLAADPAPRVREQAVTALGRIGGKEAEPALMRALDDADSAICERAAFALLAIASTKGIERVLDYVSRTVDRAAALRVASRIALREESPEILEALRAALERTDHDDPVYETLLMLKVTALEATRPIKTSGVSIDAAIAEAFPMWVRLSTVRGFEPLAKSLRTAEMLYTSTVRDPGESSDLSAAIVLWMKCLEGYMHAWLAPRLRTLQEQPSTLWELSDRLMGTAWPAYQRYLVDRWNDPVKIGALSVEVPLRSVVNALREFQERRCKSLDSPASVTEWSRMMLFFAVDHPSGPRNVLKVACKDPDRAVRLAHKLHVLAQVRNAVTHRSVAGASTLGEFRRAYYAAFEELTGMA